MKIAHDQVAIQCCVKHWRMMEQALTDRGLDHLISSNATEAGEKFSKAQKEESIESLTDPLLEAFAMMGAQIINNGIPEDKLSEITGKCICPVCLAMKLTNEPPESTETHWTSGLADYMLNEYRGRGLLPRLQ